MVGIEIMVPVSIWNCMARRVQIIIVLFYSDQIYVKLLQALLRYLHNEN